MPLTKVSAGVIAANAVQDSVGSQSITGDKLGLTAINANNIVGGAVTGDKIGATSINANNIVNASITASQLATSLNLATNNVQVASIQTATGTPAITFAANGQMTLANTPLQLTGGQIKFPATHIPSADGNTLDDYEEGTWTPSIGGDATYTVQSGYYRKIGSLVFISAYILINSKGTGSASVISGLPFNPNAGDSTNESVFALSKAEALSASVTSISLRNNGTDIYSSYRTSASSSGTVNGAYIQNATELNFSGCYLIY